MGGEELERLAPLELAPSGIMVNFGSYWCYVYLCSFDGAAPTTLMGATSTQLPVALPKSFQVNAEFKF